MMMTMKPPLIGVHQLLCVVVVLLATAATTTHAFSMHRTCSTTTTVPSSSRQLLTTTRLHASPTPPEDNNDKDDESWDEDVDYDKVWPSNEQEDIMPTAAWDDVVVDDDSSSSSNTDLDLPPALSELMDSATAAELKDEARVIIETQVQQGLDDLAKVRKDLTKDIEAQKRSLQRQSAVRAQQEETKLMRKIDALSGNFLADSKDAREATKRAAAADAAMEGKGLEVGSWGVLSSSGDGSDGAVVTMGGTDGLLGSVANAKKQQAAATDDDGADPATASRILIVADESGDPIAKQLVPKFTKAIQDIMSVEIEVLKPTQTMPLGGNNAACVLFFLTSLSNPPRALMERLLRKTMVADGKVGRPPTQLVAVSTVGTERTDKYPYSMQNLMGRKLEGRRDMEESLMNAVKEREVEPPLDYTICKFGELKDSSNKGDFSFMPGDVLDGTTSLDTATNVLVQAVAFQPSARNVTLCATGTLPPAVDDNLFWDDAFLKLNGPELARYDSLGIPADLYIQLVEYIKEWGKFLAESGKLTTPIDYDISTKGPNAAFEGVAQRDGMKLLFRPTNTGADYLSKEEEREMEKKGMTPKSSTTTTRRRGKPEGGVEILVEITTKGDLRVRAARCDMGPATVVKELSEALILKRLQKSLDVFVKDYA
mmetsp:Transcript_13064/g.21622  ORF Transcript_13064/g.21622 Transcript_13064/m.21622 type:complete len:655 (+) Transcript_13064:122-2086(+)